ncbi:hypothetical protein [Pseudomonas sp. IAC-BECa141]|uniref:hypothetical protein n=1 Tax=Pseudomonas sp. IAC-BECa141 TaxID=2793103 RepID=UPI0039B6259C
MGNAVRPGDSLQPIYVTLSQDDDCSVFGVQNRGEPIPAGVIPIFLIPRSVTRAMQQPKKDRLLAWGWGWGWGWGCSLRR